MPMYTVSSLRSLSESMMSQLSKLIMNVHYGLTGAPETFVIILYSQNVPLKKGVSLDILANGQKGPRPK